MWSNFSTFLFFLQFTIVPTVNYFQKLPIPCLNCYFILIKSLHCLVSTFKSFSSNSHYVLFKSTFHFVQTIILFDLSFIFFQTLQYLLSQLLIFVPIAIIVCLICHIFSCHFSKYIVFPSKYNCILLFVLFNLFEPLLYLNSRIILLNSHSIVRTVILILTMSVQINTFQTIFLQL